MKRNKKIRGHRGATKLIAPATTPSANHDDITVKEFQGALKILAEKHKDDTGFHTKSNELVEATIFALNNLPEEAYSPNISTPKP